MVPDSHLTNLSVKPVTLITGAAGGMGKAVCKKLESMGKKLLITDINSEKLYMLQKDLSNAEIVVSDFTQENFTDVFDKSLSIDALIHLAGSSLGDTLQHTNIHDWNTSFSINVTSAFRLLQYYYNNFTPGASIVLTGSPVSLVGARKPAYAASKAALHGLMISAARELGAKNIRVNLLLPGTCDTHMIEDWPQEKRQKVAQQNIQNRLFKPEEIAEVISFLVSSKSSMITGSVLDLTSGGLWRSN